MGTRDSRTALAPEDMAYSNPESAAEWRRNHLAEKKAYDSGYYKKPEVIAQRNSRRKLARVPLRQWLLDLKLRTRNQITN